MAAHVVTLPRARRRAAESRDVVRILHVVVGHGEAEGRRLDDEIRQASAGRIQVELVVGLGRALDQLAGTPTSLAIVQATHCDSARAALAELKRVCSALPVVLVVGDDDHHAAVAAVRAGAEDVLSAADVTGPALVRSVLCALERTSHAAALRTAAVTDPVTGLPNRHALRTRLDHALALSRRSGRAVAVLFVDLDGFKQVNDTCGHECGDRVLVEMARRFTARCRDMDTVARLGGDEFVIVMEDLEEARYAAVLAEKILVAAAAPCAVDGRIVHLTASVGISLCPTDGADAATLMRHADLAMYAAKSAGKNRSCYYAPAMNVHSHERAVLERALSAAIEQGELELHFQPVWQASGKRISSCEALLRWRRPGRGLVLPREFLALAEETGLIADIGRWTLAAACREARRMQEAGFAVPVSVNLSRRQLLAPGLADDIRRILHAESLRAADLQIEVSEAVLVDADDRVRAVLATIDAMGVALVVDDFGVGTSSLGALQRLPVRRLKVASRLVREAPAAKASRDMVRAVMALGSALGVHVMAAGVETEQEASTLLSQGYDDMQGFYYGHPLPPDEWLGYLRWACTAIVGTDQAAKATPVVRRRRVMSPRGGLPPLGSILPKPDASRVVVGRFRS